MTKKVLLFLGMILSINCFSQITFEKGYYINNDNSKIECLIKNIDWKNNPTDFEYKINENDRPKTIGLKLVKEFGVYNYSKYIRRSVLIDRSGKNLNGDLSLDKNPFFNEELLFLKVLVEGKANLYSYTDGNLLRYFYSLESSNIKQLVYKLYKTTDNDVRKNNSFRQQLWQDLKCSSIKMKNIKNLNYKKHNLINFVNHYNTCTNSESIIHEKKQKRDLFNLILRPRLNNSSLTIQNSMSNNNRDINFGSKLSLSFGVEAEYLLPFNKNKWGISIEPTYQSFKAEKTTDSENVSGGKLMSSVDYSSIEIPIGLRHYFFLNNNSKLFINTSVLLEISSKSSIKFKRADGSIIYNDLEINTRNTLALGIGYKLNDKYSLELRYFNKEILRGYAYWQSDYKTISVIFGYSIF